MWLTGRLAPEFKTIANFPRDNGAAIRAVCGQFAMLCRSMGLFSGAMVAVDGSKFKAVNNRDRNFTAHKGAARIEQVQASIDRYLVALDQADRGHSDVPEMRADKIREKVAGLRRQMQYLKDMTAQVEAALDNQISLTDPDARSMATTGRGTGVVGYTVRAAVDTEHHLIIAHEVANEGSDRAQLVPMGRVALYAAGTPDLTVLADRGYYSRDQILECQSTGVLPCVPKVDTSGRSKLGLFARPDCVYDVVHGCYRCPAGSHLTRSKVRSNREGEIGHYRNLAACHSCQLRPRCTPEKVKRVKRWAHEAILDEMQMRLNQLPDAMGIRRQTVEHVFGTLKAWMGSTPFLTRTLKNVRKEMSLSVLTYNMKRLI